MAQLRNFGVSSCLIPVTLMTGLFLVGCSNQPEPEIKVVTKVEKTQIPTVSRPKPLQLTDVRVFVVTKDNLQSFQENFEETYGELAVVVLSMRDYENLALNIAELERYIGQQKNIIVYYEEAVTDSPEKKENKSEE